MKYSKAIFAFFFFALAFLIDPSSIYAQGGAGIKLIPAVIEKAADPGEVITETITISNINDEEKEYYIYKRNIKGVGNGGTPIFAEEDSEITGYEITEWIDIQDEPIRIPANGQVDFDFTITVPENASPGSHFGGIFASIEAPRLREIGAGVGYEVATIISIRIKGDIVDSARVRSFSTDKLLYGSKDVDFLAKIENQGNILIRPVGPLTITGMWGGDPAVVLVNESLAGVFPGTVRDLEFNWQEGTPGFGRYEAVLALVYDGKDGQRTIDASLVFWVFPANIVVPLIIGLVVVLAVGYLLTRLYISRAVAQASGGRRIASTRRYRKRVGVSRFAFVFTTLLAVLAIFLIIVLIFFA